MSRIESHLGEPSGTPVRSRADIMADILNEARLSSGSRKTRLMYRCNLSFRQLQIYLKLLIKKGFLKVVHTRESNPRVEIYQITEEGLSFLKAYNDLRDHLVEKRLTP